MRVRTRNLSLQSVAVVGGGSAGIAAAKFLLAENSFERIQVFEQRRATGGMWNYTPPNLFELPSEGKPPIQNQFDFVTPIYDELESNIPQCLMQYSDFPFPKGTQLLPSHDVVRQYLQRYAEEVHHLISFETRVRQIYQLPDNRWLVEYQNTPTQNVSRETFDAVLIASGHFDDPWVPSIPGLREWQRRFAGRCSHSITYRNSAPYRGNKTLVVGNSASGSDVAAQLEKVVRTPLLISVRTMPDSQDQSQRKYLPAITRFESEPNAVHFADGHVEMDIDDVVFCTGYKCSDPPYISLPERLYNGLCTRNLYQHVFYIPNPRLAFVAMPLKSIPFPLSESQSAVIARIWSGRLQLPTQEAMVKWDADLLAKHGRLKMTPIEAATFNSNYMNYIYDWCLQASERAGLDAEGLGKLPVRWSPRDIWLRERLGPIKAAFTAKGRDRHAITTPEELGFDFSKKEDQA